MIFLLADAKKQKRQEKQELQKKQKIVIGKW